MDRLHLVIAAIAVAGIGCKEGDSKSAPTSGRVNAATGKTTAAKPTDPSSFCDVHDPGAAKSFSFPDLDAAPPKAKPSSWRWVNVWATWCKPCVEELPRLASWTERLSASGTPIDLVLVSVDETRSAITAFEAEHGAVGETARLDDPEAIKPWLVGMGLDEGAPLPVHALVDPGGSVRCMRSGAINTGDYDKVAALIGSAK